MGAGHEQEEGEDDDQTEDNAGRCDLHRSRHRAGELRKRCTGAKYDTRNPAAGAGQQHLAGLFHELHAPSELVLRHMTAESPPWESPPHPK